MQPHTIVAILAAMQAQPVFEIFRLQPGLFAIRASIAGPISTESWNAHVKFSEWAG